MKTGIIGAGVMGSGIAQVCAMAGHEVILYDLNSEALDSALNRIKSNLSIGIVLPACVFCRHFLKKSLHLPLHS